MAYRDLKNRLMDNTAVTTSAATTDNVDTGVAIFGQGTPKYLEFTVTEAATAAGAATVVFAAQDSADGTFTDVPSDRSTVDAVLTSAVPKAALVVGKTIKLTLPKNTRRYVRGYFTVATGPLTAGKFTAFLTIDE